MLKQPIDVSDWDDNMNLLFFESSEECCEMFGVDGSCVVEDVCAKDFLASSLKKTIPTSSPIESSLPASSLCTTRKWHPKLDFSNPGCSNSDDYTESWNLPEKSVKFLLDTFEECCLKFFGSICSKEDICRDANDDTATTAPASPSTSPLAVVSSTTECLSSELWHMTLDFQKCSNNFDFPSNWLQPEMRDQYMFHTLEDCCNNFFSRGHCAVEDICAPPTPIPTHTPSSSPIHMPSSSPSMKPSTGPPSSSPSLKPSTGPISDPSKLSENGTKTSIDGCENNKWHPKSYLNRVCTNDKNYSPAWNNPLVSDRFLKNSAKECCDFFYKSEDCEIVDTCPTALSNHGTPVSSDTCESKKWHPTSLHERKCSNDGVYPPLWDNLGDKFLRSSAMDCCETFYAGGDCNVENICPVPTTEKRNCEGKKWHPKSSTDRTCSNSDEFPAIWEMDGMRDTFLLSTAEKCCAAHYSDGDCKILDICE